MVAVMAAMPVEKATVANPPSSWVTLCSRAGNNGQVALAGIGIPLGFILKDIYKQLNFFAGTDYDRVGLADAKRRIQALRNDLGEAVWW